MSALRQGVGTDDLSGCAEVFLEGAYFVNLNCYFKNPMVLVLIITILSFVTIARVHLRASCAAIGRTGSW